MGLSTEINLHKASNGTYIPGDVVKGLIKWSDDKETIFNKITVSLKGYGIVVVKDKYKKRDQIPSYRNCEEYVDIDSVIYDADKGSLSCMNSNETAFSFILPKDVPPSFKYSMSKVFECNYPFRRETTLHTTDIKCKIFYYIRIKFNRPGFMKLSKHFKKEINVVSGITPNVPAEPVTYSEQKSLFQLLQLFSSKKNLVKLKARIENSILPSGGNIELNYEVLNNSNTDVKEVEVKLMEIHTFKPNIQTAVKVSTEIRGSQSRTDVVKSGDTRTTFVEINIPMDCNSIDNSNIVTRKYCVFLKAELPLPHRDIELEIPIQVGTVIADGDSDNDGNCALDQPPSYWETMGEVRDDDEVCELGDGDTRALE